VKGFDSSFKDLADYIIKITAEIWEERNVDAIYRYYHKDVLMHTSYGDGIGVESVVQNTIEVLNTFPDRQLLPQDVICDQHKGDYHSSHRIISVMHHTGHGIYGPPTNKLIQAYTFADCTVRNNQVYEEWMVRDYKAMISQMGLAPLDFVRTKLLPSLTRSPSGRKKAKLSKTGVAKPKIPQISAAAAYIEAQRALWEGKKLGLINKIYRPGCILFLPGGKVRYGWQAADAFFLSYMTTFSDLRLRIDRVTVNEKGGPFLRVAIRWNLEGIHSGAGLFGEPTFAPISIMGISHAELYKERVISQWIGIDELAILAQVEMRRHSL